jgi:HPt (histidine-containing phosphotransfer) domain-containing protein
VGSEAVPAARSASARQVLREAFATELAERLPRLVAMQDLDAARRDAHTLVSSAWVVGEPEISRLARAVEEHLEDGPLDQLVARLQAWTP